MTDNKDLKYTEQIKNPTWTPQTQEVQYVETEDLYPDLVHEDISSSKGYGPCTRSDCTCTPEQLRQQLRDAQRRTFHIRVRITNSSGRGVLGTGRDSWDFYDTESARSFATQVSSDGWAVGGSTIWGTRYITCPKRNDIVSAIRNACNDFERGTGNYNQGLDF